MQISRLFEIIYVLLEKKTVKASELSERFEVSTKTIYRDVETLSMAGIPIFAMKGRNGGISLSDGFVLNKSILTEKEQAELLRSLEGLAALKNEETDPLLKKLSAFFQKNSTSWIEIDFSRWNNGEKEKSLFDGLKTGIFENRKVTFTYAGAQKKSSHREVTPLKLCFRGQSWYMLGFCEDRKALRYFKITRMRDLEVKEEVGDVPIFEDHKDESIADDPMKDRFLSAETKEFLLLVDPIMGYRVYDEFEEEKITETPEGLYIKATLPLDEWTYGYFLSFGEKLEVLEPQDVREEMIKRCGMVLERYK